MDINVLDLFAGAGGLTEGFLKEGYNFIGHIEMDNHACETLKTRVLFHHLNKNGKLKEYKEYLLGNIDRDHLIKKYNLTGEINKIYNKEISDNTYSGLLSNLKESLGKNKLHLLIGGPPCQTYSQIGRARVGKKICKDPRNFLYLQYAKFLKDLQPEIFIFENVPGLKTAGGGKYLEDIKKAVDKAGYYIETKTEKVKQYMPEYGIPQNRTRLILMGWKKNSEIIQEYPNLSKYKTISNAGVLEYTYIVNDFLKDLKNIKQGGGKKIMKYKSKNEILEKLGIRNKNIDFVHNHITRPIRELDRKIYKIAVKEYNKGNKLKYPDLPEELKTHKNKHSFLNRFNVVAGNDKITSTVVAHISSDGHYYIHPDIKQNRSLSIREAARLQTFPDDFIFEGPRTSVFKQIGNAVPPIFSHILAKEFKTYFSKKGNKKN